MYEVSLALLQAYSEVNLGRTNLEVLAEEEQYRDLSLMMELLSSLFSRDMFVFLDDGRHVLGFKTKTSGSENIHASTVPVLQI